MCRNQHRESGKMKEDRNMSQMKEQGKPQKEKKKEKETLTKQIYVIYSINSSK